MDISVTLKMLVKLVLGVQFGLTVLKITRKLFGQVKYFDMPSQVVFICKPSITLVTWMMKLSSVNVSMLFEVIIGFE